MQSSHGTAVTNYTVDSCLGGPTTISNKFNSGILHRCSTRSLSLERQTQLRKPHSLHSSFVLKKDDTAIVCTVVVCTTRVYSVVRVAERGRAVCSQEAKYPVFRKLGLGERGLYTTEKPKTTWLARIDPRLRRRASLLPTYSSSLPRVLPRGATTRRNAAKPRTPSNVINGIEEGIGQWLASSPRWRSSTGVQPGQGPPHRPPWLEPRPRCPEAGSTARSAFIFVPSSSERHFIDGSLANDVVSPSEDRYPVFLHLLVLTVLTTVWSSARSLGERYRSACKERSSQVCRILRIGKSSHCQV